MRMGMTAKGMLTVVALAGAPCAQEQERLPSAREVIEKFIEKTGGRTAYEGVKTRVVTGKVNVSFMDQTFTGTFIRYESAPNLVYMRVDLGEFGTMENGTDGKVHWEISTMAGVSVLSGMEKAMAERDARFHHDLEWFDLYEKIEVKGEETLEDTPCFLLRMTPKTGNAEDAYFEKSSGLLVATLVDHPANPSNLTIWTTLNSFKEVDGLHLPHETYSFIEGLEQEFSILTENIEHNVAIPASRYELPAAIKTLVGKRDGE